MPAVVPMVIPRAIPADPVRPVISPDYPAVAARIAVIVRRSVEAPEVMPVSEVRPVVRVAIAAMVERAIAGGHAPLRVALPVLFEAQRQQSVPGERALDEALNAVQLGAQSSAASAV